MVDYTGSPATVANPDGSRTFLPIVSTTVAAAGTNRSLTATTTAANAMPVNAARRLWKIKNDSAVDVWINFYATATAVAGGGNIKIAAGAYFASEPAACETGAMSIIATSATATVTIVEV